MTAIDQVTALVDAHVNRDHERFRAVTLQIAAAIAGRSAPRAERLRALIERHQAQAFVPMPSAQGLLSSPPNLSTFDDMILAPVTRAQIDRIVFEHARRMDLLAQDLRPASKLLFTGSPGCGKSMASGAIACAIKLPLFRVELHAVIGSHLGETAANLAKVFQHIRSMPAVYLFDEFDALGADRSSVTDGSSAGAEMRRTVNSLLQLIEDDRSDSLIVAATNHDQMLDPALFRRFDEVIAFPPMSMTELTVLTQRKLRDFDQPSLDYEAIHAANPSLGHADLCVVLDRVRKDYVLSAIPIDTARIVAGIATRTRNGAAA